MQHASLKDQMHYYLNNGIVQDIVLAQQAYDLLMTVGKNGPKIGVSAYADFFQNLQSVLSDNFVLHVTKLFEQPNNRYETISIPTILKFISENAEHLQIIEQPLVLENLYRLGVVANNSTSATDLSKIIIKYFKHEVLMKENSPALQGLQVLRNKRIAHREAIDISNFPFATFKDALELVKFAQNFVIIVGAAYTSHIYGFVNESFFLAEDIKKSLTSLEKIFTALLKS